MFVGSSYNVCVIQDQMLLKMLVEMHRCDWTCCGGLWEFWNAFGKNFGFLLCWIFLWIFLVWKNCNGTFIKVLGICMVLFEWTWMSIYEVKVFAKFLFIRWYHSIFIGLKTKNYTWHLERGVTSVIYFSCFRTKAYKFAKISKWPLFLF